jgi:adenosylcobinamide kinase/adenosylcobinamide-phosphate guanylyltransferase
VCGGPRCHVGSDMSLHHLIVGGQRSGKSSQAERLAQQWLSAAPGREVLVLATAVASDEEMHERITRHRQDRPEAFGTLEVPLALGEAIAEQAAPHRLLLVDCLTLWLTNVLMPMHALAPAGAPAWPAARSALLNGLGQARQQASPVVLISNEVGWGVVPMGREVREFVDELGRLNQDVALACDALTLMVAGQAWTRPVEARS